MDGIPVGAVALYNLLAALFKYMDEEIEPKNLGVVTMAKNKFVCERIGMLAEFSGTISLPPQEAMRLYSAMDCQYFIIPARYSGNGTHVADAKHDYGFEEPHGGQAALTMAGFIKCRVLAYILDSQDPTKADMQYRYLQNCIRTLPLYYIDQTGTRLTFPPLPSQDVVLWYHTVFAKSVLGIADPTCAGIQALMAAKARTGPPPATYAGQPQTAAEMAEANLLAQQQRYQIQMDAQNRLANMELSLQINEAANAMLTGRKVERRYYF